MNQTFDREETYDPQLQNIWCFKHVDDIDFALLGHPLQF